MNPTISAFIASGGESILKGLIARMSGAEGFIFRPGSDSLTRDQIANLKARLVAKGYEPVTRFGPQIEGIMNNVAQAMEYATLYNNVRNPNLTIDPRVPYPGQSADSPIRTYTVLVQTNLPDGTRAESLIDIKSTRALSQREIQQVAVMRAEELVKQGQSTVISGQRSDQTWTTRVLSAYRGEVLPP